MILAGVKDVKNNLSRFLAQVKAGEEILITERGKPIARIVKEKHSEKSIHAALGPLIQKGMIALPSRHLQREHLVPVEVSGKPISEMVIEDRR
jgi:prevent-host-death family protein